jgi:hypothetical protein
VVFTTTADAVQREAAWLSTANDGLPNLLSDAGGRWDLVNAYWNRTPVQRQRVIWVNKSHISVKRFAHVRKIVTYHFELELWWPLSTQTGSSESDQAQFDLAINDLVMRISGFGYTPSTTADKTHGGRFLSAAETMFSGDSIDISTPPASSSLPATVGYLATVTYAAEDEFNN